uniref:Uncharacterized protein n=1 Tax=Kalanchoe fedtschenkoi TaxID=63787 RepID=A0A7N0RG00_KALFE
MAALGTQIMLQRVSHGCLSMQDTETDRRPYHRNCSCALHKPNTLYSKSRSQQKNSLFLKKQPLKVIISLRATTSSSVSHYVRESSSKATDDQFRPLLNR